MENHLIKKENENSANLTTYASGDGSLSFVFDKRFSREASGVKVSFRDADIFIKNNPELKDWKIIKISNGIIKAYQPVQRVSEDELNFKGKSFFYQKNKFITAYNKYDFFMEDLKGEMTEVKNMNIISALSFWLDNVED